MTNLRSTSRTSPIRRRTAAVALTLTLAGSGAAFGTSAHASGTDRKQCPAAEISAVWYGGTSDDPRCEYMADRMDHMFYGDPMLTTEQRHRYQERATFVQLRLRDLGYRPLVVDGKYGPQTAGAVTRYQKNKGLIVDGRVGPQTWKALFGLGRA